VQLRNEWGLEMMVPRVTEAIIEHRNSRRKEKAFVIWPLTSSNILRLHSTATNAIFPAISLCEGVCNGRYSLCAAPSQ